jgi:uncharacterized protein (DUF3820 family)
MSSDNTTVRTSAIVPFGKYKGQPLEALRADRGYLDWLVGQDWFRARHTAMYQIIVNNFGEPAETPEHNRLQNRFLDDGFCQAFSRKWKSFVDSRDHLVNDIKLLKGKRGTTNSLYDYVSREIEDNIARHEQALVRFDAAPPTEPHLLTIEAREFEVGGCY